jgi:hypothetical protein
MVDDQLKKVCTNLNRTWSERYINANDDIGYIRNLWSIILEVEEGQGYKGEPISPWSSVEGIVTDCYLDLISTNTTKDNQNKKIESLMHLHNVVLEYLYKKTNSERPGDIEPYIRERLKSYNLIK